MAYIQKKSDANVGVGSIAHILKSAFKNIYEDEKAESDAFAADQLALAVKVALEHASKHEDLTKTETVEKARSELKKARVLSTAKSPIAAVQQSVSDSQACSAGK